MQESKMLRTRASEKLKRCAARATATFRLCFVGGDVGTDVTERRRGLVARLCWSDRICHNSGVESSDKLGPVVVGHEIWTSPLFAVHVDARASKVAVLRVFENGNPGRRFGVLEPLRANCVSVPCLLTGWGFSGE
jgi:hypothetical protein